MECISSSWFTIVINGSRKGFFPSQRGLRHRDPLSPFLLVIVGEAFSLMLAAAEVGSLIHGFAPAPNSLVISHLQFADGTLIFCDANVDQVEC